jgi:hypothetical protein
MRRSLTEKIWRDLGGDLPQTVPSAALNQNIHYKAANFDPNCVRLDQLAIVQPLGWTAHVDLLHPLNPINRCAVSWPGHGMHYYSGNQPGIDTNAQFMVMALLAAGFHVICPDLPGHGFGGTLSLTGGLKIDASHLLADMQAISAAGVSPELYFTDPVVQAINYCEAHFSFDEIVGTGLSGGGRGMEFLSAVDSRVVKSAPYFGSLMSQFTNPGQFDGEQTRSWDFYTVLGDLDVGSLGILGAIEPHRRQMKVWGSVEPVFPTEPPNRGGTLSTIHAAYQPVIDATNGRWSYYRDTNTVHGYSTAGIAAVIDFFLS